MEQFKISQNGIKKLRNAIIIKTLPLVLIAGFSGIAISYFNSNHQDSYLNIVPFMIPIISGAMAIGLYIGIKRQKEIFGSYTLTIDNYKILREQLYTPTISILKSEIKEIIKNSNQSFTIKSNANTDIIIVFSQIDEYDKLEKLLSEIKQITILNKKPIIERLLIPIVIIYLGIFAAFLLSNNKIIDGVCGTTLLIVSIFSFFEMKRNKNFDNKTKKGSWTTIFILIFIIVNMYVKLFGPL